MIKKGKNRFQSGKVEKHRADVFPVFESALSNSLIIYQDRTKKITTVKEVWIPVLISIDFDDFPSPFTP